MEKVNIECVLEQNLPYIKGKKIIYNNVLVNDINNKDEYNIYIAPLLNNSYILELLITNLIKNSGYTTYTKTNSTNIRVKVIRVRDKKKIEFSFYTYFGNLEKTTYFKGGYFGSFASIYIGIKKFDVDNNLMIVFEGAQHQIKGIDFFRDELKWSSKLEHKFSYDMSGASVKKSSEKRTLSLNTRLISEEEIKLLCELGMAKTAYIFYAFDDAVKIMKVAPTPKQSITFDANKNIHAFGFEFSIIDDNLANIKIP